MNKRGIGMIAFFVPFHSPSAGKNLPFALKLVLV